MAQLRWQPFAPGRVWELRDFHDIRGGDSFKNQLSDAIAAVHCTKEGGRGSTVARAWPLERQDTRGAQCTFEVIRTMIEQHNANVSTVVLVYGTQCEARCKADRRHGTTRTVTWGKQHTHQSRQHQHQ